MSKSILNAVSDGIRKAGESGVVTTINVQRHPVILRVHVDPKPRLSFHGVRLESHPQRVHVDQFQLMEELRKSAYHAAPSSGSADLQVWGVYHNREHIASLHISERLVVLEANKEHILSLVRILFSGNKPIIAKV